MVEGLITHIEAQRRRPDRLNVYVDGVFAMAVDREVAMTAGIEVGRALTATDRAALQVDDERARAVAAAIRLLAHRPRSEREVRQRLQQRGVVPDVIDATVEHLSQSGLLDDTAFTSFWVENREQFNPRGARLLAQELGRKGIDREIVAEALTAIDEDTGADRACEKKLRTLAGLPEDVFRRKLTAFLLRRGFDYETTKRAVERAWAACHS